MFIGRRPGTAPVRYREQPVMAGAPRKRADRILAAVVLVAETLVCLTLWGPQPAGWLWVGSQVDYRADSVSLGILTAFAGMLLTLFLTLALAKRMDNIWKLVRRAGGYEQKDGMLERIFVISLIIAGSIFSFWFFIIEGPGPTLAPQG